MAEEKSSSSSSSTVRRRRVEPSGTESHSAGNSEPKDGPEDSSSDPEKEKEKRKVHSLRPGTYWLTRILLLRAVAFIYFVAFSVAFHQNKQLIGEKGLLPCKTYLNSVKRYVGGKIGAAALAYTPSILWFLDWTHMDSNLDAIAAVGMALSGLVLITGTANMLIMALLWVLYHSLVNVGQLWYSFGWESQLLETGFLAIFLCPVWSLSRPLIAVPPPSSVCGPSGGS
ncbi:hypothetical protein WMY93_010025 [Mugilogobius chulae]|uniref:Lipase maturation factor n=1 Tax=Mugilogobius chulae TaxID=88201 RepID=A0AAW0P9J6_9GOBI